MATAVPLTVRTPEVSSECKDAGRSIVLSRGNVVLSRDARTCRAGVTVYCAAIIPPCPPLASRFIAPKGRYALILWIGPRINARREIDGNVFRRPFSTTMIIQTIPIGNQIDHHRGGDRRGGDANDGSDNSDAVKPCDATDYRPAP